MSKLTRLQWLGLAVIVGLLALTTLGGAVRVTDSGLACPDWPLCYGQVLPTGDYPPFAAYQVWLEWTHRLAASLIGLLVIAYAALTWLRLRARPAVWAPAVSAVAMLGVQVGLGALTVTEQLEAAIVTAHLAVAMLIVMLVSASAAASIAASAAAGPTAPQRDLGAAPDPAAFARLALLAGFSVYALIVLGSYVTHTDAGFFCGNQWPLCNGDLWPESPKAAAACLPSTARCRRRRAGGCGLGASCAAGAAIESVDRACARREYAIPDSGDHRSAHDVARSDRLDPRDAPQRRGARLGPGCRRRRDRILARRLARAEAQRARADARGRAVSGRPHNAAAVWPRIGSWRAPAWLDPLHALIELMKPGIIWLLLVTTIPAMVLAANGWPGWGLAALTLLGGVLTAGGANALNQWFDRDIDRVMQRTASRPLPRGALAPWQALSWGLLLAAAGGLQLGLTVGWLAAVLALAAVAFYVFVYTLWLKRWTRQNIVIGGAAGAVPPLVGWAAVTGEISWTAAALFLIVVMWTPPHFWALALKYRDDYARAEVPMLPVVSGEAETRRQILYYSAVLWAVTLLAPLGGHLGWLYFGAALAAGAAFTAIAWQVWRGGAPPMRLFFASIAYLFILFAAVGLDVLV